MPHVVRVHAAGTNTARPADSVMLSGDQRRVQRGELIGVNGTRLTFALADPVLLRMGDVLELDDGNIVDVVVEPEPLVEIRGADLTHLARLAWHLGDRHVPLQILSNRLRMRRDGVLEAMLSGLGARLVAIEAPFDPEGGAYAAPAANGHLHVHGHHDDHDHGHHHDHHGHDHK
jgi:urease accessory protein